MLQECINEAKWVAAQRKNYHQTIYYSAGFMKLKKQTNIEVGVIGFASSPREHTIIVISREKNIKELFNEFVEEYIAAVCCGTAKYTCQMRAIKPPFFQYEYKFVYPFRMNKTHSTNHIFKQSFGTVWKIRKQFRGPPPPARIAILIKQEEKEEKEEKEENDLSADDAATDPEQPHYLFAPADDKTRISEIAQHFAEKKVVPNCKEKMMHCITFKTNKKQAQHMK